MGYREIIEKYGHIVRICSKKHGLTPYLIYGIIMQESSGDPSAVSKCGAVGLTQIMPIALKDYNQRNGTQIEPEQLYIPDVNIEIGASQLAWSIKQFSGDQTKGIQAYNQGVTRVKRDQQAGMWYANGVLKHGRKFKQLLETEPPTAA